MIRRPPRSTRTDTLFPYTTLFRSFVQISVRPARRCLDQRIWQGLEVEIGVERWRNQRVGEADKLDDAVLGKLDVEQTEQRLVNMREHNGGRGQLPSIAPAIIDAEKGFLIITSEARLVGKECVNTCR